MKEKGPIRKALETAGKVWTLISIPVELFLLGHGIATGNKIEAIAGAVGLIGDFFAWKWLSRERRREQLKSTSGLNFAEKGLQRVRNAYPVRLTKVELPLAA